METHLQHHSKSNSSTAMEVKTRCINRAKYQQFTNIQIKISQLISRLRIDTQAS